MQNLPFLVTQKLPTSTICLHSTMNNHFKFYVYFSELVKFVVMCQSLCVVLSDAFVGLAQQLSLHSGNQGQL